MRSLNDLEIRKNLRFNILVNLLDGGFFGLGIGFSCPDLAFENLL